jgi:hypothetical protein
MLDSRVAFNVGEIAKLVPHIKHFYGTKFGGGKDSREDCSNEVTEDETVSETVLRRLLRTRLMVNLAGKI